MSGAFGIGPDAASIVVNAAGGWPVSTASACRVCSMPVCNAGSNARVCSVGGARLFGIERRGEPGLDAPLGDLQRLELRLEVVLGDHQSRLQCRAA